MQACLPSVARLVSLDVLGLIVETKDRRCDGKQQKDSEINRKVTFGGGQNLVSNAQLQDPLLLTGTWDLYNYVNVVPGRLCLKDTEDGSRRA
jgi:hypothetical protein